MAYTSIYKGDDTSAFGNNFIRVKAKIPEGFIITKAKIRIGNLPIVTVMNPTFPLIINLTAAQTRQLSTQNECYMAVYDEQNRKRTCTGVLKFIAKDEVV